MKSIFKIFLALSLAAVAAVACYDDTDIKNELADLKDRVKTLEDLVRTANSNISGLQNMVAALNGKVYVDDVKETAEGWVISFSDGKKYTVTNGTSPRVGAKKDSDGVYYWTLDGGWLLGDDGQKIPVSGNDGLDAVAPQLKIEGDYWYLSTDGGKTWKVQGKAQGEPGSDASCIFKSFSQDDSFWYFTLANDEVIRIGKGIKGAKAVWGIPEWAGGALGMGPGSTPLRFMVLPAESAESLAAVNPECFTLDVVYTTPTKAEAGDEATLPITGIKALDGVLVLTVDGDALAPEFFEGTLGASACLSIVSGENVLTSGYFPLQYYDRYNGHEAVDLGLSSGLKWATCNAGADKPEESGDYYAWGENAPKNTYNWASYKWCQGNQNTFIKYCLEGDAALWAGADSPDGKQTVEGEDDAAFVAFGGVWRMPTVEEWAELMDNCLWTWTELNGTSGYRVSSKTSADNWIFLPAAGYYSDITLGQTGVAGYYWSNTLSSSSSKSRRLKMSSGLTDLTSGSRYYGMTVRAVCE